MKFKKPANVAQNLADNIITVNKFFAHWIKEINIINCGTDKNLIPTATPLEIYQYSDSMFKHLPKDALKKIEKDFLYSKKAVIFNSVNFNRRLHSSNTPADITDPNFTERVNKFANQPQLKYVYRIPLRYLCDLDIIHFPIKIDLKILCTLETEMRKLFETKQRVANISAPNAQIIFTKAPFIQYEQFLPAKNFSQYLETILISSKILRMDIQKTPYKETYEMQSNSQDFMVDFQGYNRQFDWLEISLVYGINEKHLTIYNSYSAECAAQMIKSIELANISENYSSTNVKRYHTSNDTQKHLVYKQFVAWYCNDCSNALVTTLIT